MKKYCLGIDVGSVSTDMVLIDENGNIFKKVYLRTNGKPVQSVERGLRKIIGKNTHIIGVGATGSGRKIVAHMLGADVVKNEITAHATASMKSHPEVKTVMEIGGQDSKIIFINDGIVTDFNMNTVCAAGTGSFLDRQAERLAIKISDMGKIALESKKPTAIAGRCAVFAESDMIHKAQQGCNESDILAGLCDALVRNYINNLTAGRQIKKPVMFQGGVAANEGIVHAFQKQLNTDIIIPENYDVMGAWGVALLALEKVKRTGETKFMGANRALGNWTVTNVNCGGCANNCSIAVFSLGGEVVGKMGNKCDRCEMRIS